MYNIEEEVFYLDFSLAQINNPWWKDRDSIRFDIHVENFENSVFKHIPRFLSILERFEEGIFTIRGPRQIGKTTVLKLLIKKLLDLGEKPVNIFYISLDMIEDNEELLKLLMDYLNFLESFGRRKTDKVYIFLDEISSVKNWQAAIKYLYDAGFFKKSFVVLTGSSSYDLKRSSERLPGRRGAGIDIVYLPVTFKEFIEQKYGVRMDHHLRDLFSMNESDIEKLVLQLSMYRNDFTSYMTTGGFPKVIDSYLKGLNISSETLNTYRDYLYSDIEKFGKSRFIMNQILFKLPEIIGQRFSWNSLAGELEGVSSKNTVEDYFNLLGMNFLIGTLFFYDFSKGVVRPKKQKKVYPVDVIITKVIEQVTGKRVEESKIVEQIVFTHLLRFSKDFNSGLVLYTGPYYWYSEKSKEIDFLVNLDGTIVPVEVKYKNKISPSDFLTMKKVFNRGILVTKKDTFKVGNIVVLPIYAFLLMCG